MINKINLFAYFFLITFIFKIYEAKSNKVNKDDWIVPGQIFSNSDYINKDKQHDSWVDPRKLFSESNIDTSGIIKDSNLDAQISKLEKNLNKCTSDLLAQKEIPHKTEFIFFKRFISSLERQFSLLAYENDSMNGHYECDINLSHSNYKYLTTYLEQSSSIEKITILESIFTNVRWIEYQTISEKLFSEEYLEICKIVLLVITCTFLFIKLLQTFYILNLSLYKLTIFSLIILFAISVPWTWWHLYQKAKSKKMSEMFKGMPDSCKDDNETFWKSFINMFTIRQDECSKYFESSYVHPFLEVTPTMALSVSLTRFLFEPAEYVGAAFRRFVISTFKDLPFYLYGVPIFFMVLIFVTTLFAAFGYRLRSTFFSIEPAPGSTTSNRVDNRAYEKLQLKFKTLKKKLIEIESKTSSSKMIQD